MITKEHIINNYGLARDSPNGYSALSHAISERGNCYIKYACHAQLGRDHHIQSIKEISTVALDINPEDAQYYDDILGEESPWVNVLPRGSFEPIYNKSSRRRIGFTFYQTDAMKECPIYFYNFLVALRQPMDYFHKTFLPSYLLFRSVGASVADSIVLGYNFKKAPDGANLKTKVTLFPIMDGSHKPVNSSNWGDYTGFCLKSFRAGDYDSKGAQYWSSNTSGWRRKDVTLNIGEIKPQPRRRFGEPITDYHEAADIYAGFMEANSAS